MKIKRIVLLILAAAGAATLLAAVPLGRYAYRVEHHHADSTRGYRADFYLYTSAGARSAKRATILVQPNNSGTNSDNPSVHRRDAWWTGFERQKIADELGVVLLVPAFIRPGEDWRILTHALDRDVMTTSRVDLARLDLQLLAMIDEARRTLAEQGIATDERVLMQGFSASGMFVNRFTALHPRRVKAATAGSPGGWPIAPVAQYMGEALPYPAGVADLPLLTHEPFDSVAYSRVPQLIYMGSADDNDSVDFRDGWDEGAAAQVDRLFGKDPLARWSLAQSLYRARGAKATFTLVPDVGHDRRKLQHLSTEFFARVLGR